MFSGSMSLTVLVHGQSGQSVEAREFVSPQDRNTYIEGREGSRFTLRIRNGSHKRVLAIPSVDGMSTLNKEPAGPESPGFVLKPFETISIEGWTLDDREAAEFYFAGSKDGVDDSYVARSGGDVANKGVIGVMFVEERRQMSAMLSSSPLRGMDGVLFASSASASMSPQSADEGQTLGAGFGRATSMPTRSVSFLRGAMVGTIALYYDDARGLKRKGIDLSRPAAPMPNPFPGIGCPPPPGWAR